MNVRWQRAREMGRNFCSITLAQRMVKKRVRRGSIYAWRGKLTALG